MSDTAIDEINSGTCKGLLHTEVTTIRDHDFRSSKTKWVEHVKMEGTDDYSWYTCANNMHAIPVKLTEQFEFVLSGSTSLAQLLTFCFFFFWMSCMHYQKEIGPKWTCSVRYQR